ncbi:hypothetical protein A2995_01020 [Candidatus Nomurabacteria bacterium RIFCSPLOWO2_01_FULL_33_24]|uniref:RNA polymerase sigma factor n=1 Tax=Candidatus Nomurabacteria bacterium RIFCSPLOWO2_01_FULL_33_24 TaxID=1801765 RepID=A0A1F6WZU8_9BACT|nr:MAG: hypothetical protein A2995_01020 [Candidatus Nomurabacteria bacterium RIFCSPLOWO2_01_FULL_33_24]
MKEVPRKTIKALFEDARNGNQKAFEIIYKQLYTPLFRFIYFRIKEVDETKDLTQIVFLKIFKSINNFKNREINILPYFFAIARNTVIDYWRQKKNILIKEEEMEKHLNETINPFQQKEIKDAVQVAIQILPENQQEIIILKFINELENKEISAITKKSEETIRQLQSRGLKKLRKYFEENNIL